MNDRHHVTNLTLGLLAASFVVCTAVWVGAQLAARLFGSGHWLDIDLAEALHAALRLGAHLDAPRRAWSATVDDKKAIKFEAKLDPSKSPKEIDITLLEKFGGKDGFRMTGIYKLDGDTLTVCRTVSPDYERPKEFKVAEGHVLIVFKRAEKKK